VVEVVAVEKAAEVMQVVEAVKALEEWGVEAAWVEAAWVQVEVKVQEEWDVVVAWVAVVWVAMEEAEVLLKVAMYPCNNYKDPILWVQIKAMAL
jgi:hypothetical protein